MRILPKYTYTFLPCEVSPCRSLQGIRSPLTDCRKEAEARSPSTAYRPQISPLPRDGSSRRPGRQVAHSTKEWRPPRRHIILIIN